MKTQKKFVITNKVDLMPDKVVDIDELQDVLTEYANKINYTHWGFTYNQRVYFYVAEGIIDKYTVNLAIGFKSKDMQKYPDKFGEEFRSKCKAFAWEQANKLLNDNRNFMVITIREDWDGIEAINYERRLNRQRILKICSMK